MSSAVDQAVACAPVMQRARVRSTVVTNLLGEVFSGFFLTCTVRQMSGSFRPPRFPEYHLAIIIILIISALLEWMVGAWAEFILQTFHLFTYVTTHSPTLPSLYLRYSSFSNPSVASHTSEFILQPFLLFSYVTSWIYLKVTNENCSVMKKNENFPSLHLRNNSFSNPSVALPTSQFIHHPFRCFTYVTVHSPTLLSLLLRHSSFSNLSVASPTSQFILQPFFRFSYVTGSSLTSPG